MRRLAPGARRAIAGLLLVCLAAAAPGPASAQPVVSPRLRAESARIFRELAQLRGFPLAGAPPTVVLRSREDRRRFIARELARKYSPARLDAERRAMAAWRLIPSDFDLGGFLTDLVLEQAAAYYDPVAKVMVLATWLGPDDQRDALTHELVHALQDRQTDLDRFLAGTAGKSDEALARQALIEGEAVALTLDLGLRRQGQDLARLPDVHAHQRAILGSATGPFLARAPRFLQVMLTFPYAHGLGFVHAFLRQRAWSDLSALYRDPPRSSAQILRPARFLERREDPLPVTLADLGATLGGGARRVIEDELGEFVLGQVVAQPATAEVPLDGWRGDRYALWEAPGGDTLLAALTAWAGEDTASVFADLAVRRLTRLHGPPDPGATDSLATWTDAHRAHAVERRGARVLLLEGAPTGALEAIRRALWAERS